MKVFVSKTVKNPCIFEHYVSISPLLTIISSNFWILFTRSNYYLTYNFVFIKIDSSYRWKKSRNTHRQFILTFGVRSLIWEHSKHFQNAFKPLFTHSTDKSITKIRYFKSQNTYFPQFLVKKKIRSKRLFSKIHS